ncbi:MAG: dipicolinate synthase subunit A [Ruminococcus sp.]|nr:dipicolinate synthase subunit A [Ruminococcus sp.]
MKKEMKILIAGGDMRQIYCAGRLALRYSTSIAGFDAAGFSEPFPAVGSCGCAVLPVQMPDSDGNIPAPFGAPLSASAVASAVRDGGIIFTGRTDSRLCELFPRQRLISYLECEELLLRNAVLTAEGAVQLALERLDTALCGLPVLIVGLGRIGSALVPILRGFGAEVTAAVRSPEAEAKADKLGIGHIRTDSISGDFALVFNTAPATVFTLENISRFNKRTLFIELASDSGGFDKASSESLGQRLIRAGGLPGKTAPVTAGEIIADAVTALIEEGGGCCEN